MQACFRRGLPAAAPGRAWRLIERVAAGARFTAVGRHRRGVAREQPAGETARLARRRRVRARGAGGGEAATGGPGQAAEEPEEEKEDLVISLEKIIKESKLQKKQFSDHLAHMVIHSLLHLLGFNHEKLKDFIEEVFSSEGYTVNDLNF